ncbi:Aminomethyltransferase folate-binding domain-containing protein [Hypoxylon trugodes]|uniref:Aminomethyltransferase folate-binding domain-containing protein n=1 Tax=Hypoxylon trugodes TaxID=326681 RepID=UPI002196D416|nr:Aminomethyltransferase folate-binding domain-containing protein [Hypoxylon trugodes]KAI1384464.1 Aminomethyltransferase folate-binding domain-containing protein [Hypoxylon trugodes]
MPILARASPGRALRPFVCQSCQQSLRRQQRQFSVSSSRATTTTPHPSPPTPPPSGYAHLTSRRLISVAGPDAPKFLHGIITQSVIDEPATSGGRHRHNAPPRIEATMANAPGFYAGFLNATGRVLHDIFVYRDTLGLYGTVTAGDNEAFIVEVDATQVDTLARHIKRYKLRSKLQFWVLEEGECAAWQVWDDSLSSSLPPPSTPHQQLQRLLLEKAPSRLSQLKDSIILPDTRAPGLGYRVIRRGEGGLDLDLNRADDAAYRVRRYLHGVAEGQAEISREQALPLESNMDVEGGIDFRKGCYVGQELTIRTKHRGVVRKRILPCLLYPTSSSPPPPQSLEYRPSISEGDESQALSAQDIPSNLSIGRYGAKGRSAGTWLTGLGNVGLALCRLQIMTDVELPGETAAGASYDPSKDEFVVKWGAEEQSESGAQSAKIKAFVPDWLRERLRENDASSPAH